MSNLLSPLDGRYEKYTKKYQETLSENAYIRERVNVEIQYLIELMDCLKHRHSENLTKYENPNSTQIDIIKEFEKITNHDVKAIEYYLQKMLKLDSVDEQIIKYIHFGLTSQDINSLGFMILFKKSISIFLEDCRKLVNELMVLIKECNFPILTRTHGQFAIPSILSKELYVYIYRLNKQIEKLDSEKLTAKFGGAVGNFNAHHFVFPNIDWLSFADRFVEKYGFERSQFTKQIDNYDSIASAVDLMKRIIVIINDLQNNLWLYISDDYFIQRVVKSEVGSSTMPHKVNPIHFENARGNIEIFVKLSSAYTESLPVSQYQRDLKDSTLLRSIGLLFGYGSLIIGQMTEGIKRIYPNEVQIQKDLNDNPIVLSEAIQSLLRTDPTIDNPYEILKNFSRNGKVTKDTLDSFINSLDCKKEISLKLSQLKIDEYTGIFPNLNI